MIDKADREKGSDGEICNLVRKTSLYECMECKASDRLCIKKTICNLSWRGTSSTPVLIVTQDIKLLKINTDDNISIYYRLSDLIANNILEYNSKFTFNPPFYCCEIFNKGKDLLEVNLSQYH